MYLYLSKQITKGGGNIPTAMVIFRCDPMLLNKTEFSFDLEHTLVLVIYNINAGWTLEHRKDKILNLTGRVGQKFVKSVTPRHVFVDLSLFIRITNTFYENE